MKFFLKVNQMTTAELATIILLVCGKGDSDYTLDCRDYMVNCAVNSQGEIKKEKVIECTEKQRQK